jgi:hypothetical protein
MKCSVLWLCNNGFVDFNEVRKIAYKLIGKGKVVPVLN